MREFASSAYDPIARYYDAFTDHPGYPEWIRRLLAIALSHGTAAERVLDVACGTGKSFLPLVDTSREVVGCDLSAGMLEVARKKTGGTVELHHLDMRRLPRLGSFDLVTCLNDSLNYLVESRDLEEALAGMGDNLASDGVVMFDVNSHHGHESFFTRSHEQTCGDGTIRWIGRGRWRRGSVWFAEGCLEFQPREGQAPSASSVHLQRHYSRRAVAEAVRKSGLKVAMVYGVAEDGSVDASFSEGRHIKALYIARKPQERG